MKYGSDFYLDGNGDIEFTPEDDVLLEESIRIIAQDLREEASIPYGSVPWDAEAGSRFFEMINDHDFQDDDVIGELERLALKDPRIDASTVEGGKTSEGKFWLYYKPLNSSDDDKLYFDLEKLLGGTDIE